REASALAERARGLIKRLDTQWIPASALPTGLIHGDVRLGNFSVDRAGTAVYLDFGFAASRPRVHDLAYALSWIVLRPDDRGRAEDFTWHLVPELIAAYERG